MKTVIERLMEAGIFTYPLNVPISAENRKLIEWAIGLLHSVTDREECYCDESEKCSLDHPRCRFRELLAAEECLQAIINPVHRSLTPDRASSYPELIFLRRWIKEQERSPGLNGGYGLLELLLTPTRAPRDRWDQHRSEYIPPVSQRDAEVAATVIQWLGTNCGRCFVESAEREIREARKDYSQLQHELHLNTWQKHRVVPRDEVIAREAAIKVMRADDPKFEMLVAQIIGAIQASKAEHSEAGAT